MKLYVVYGFDGVDQSVHELTAGAEIYYVGSNNEEALKTFEKAEREHYEDWIVEMEVWEDGVKIAKLKEIKQSHSKEEWIFLCSLGKD